MSSFEGKIKKEHIIISVFVFLILVVTAIYIIKTGDGDIILKSNNGLSVENRMEFKQQEEKKIETIRINVRGEINNPGIVEMEKGKVIIDAVDLAGGFTDEADVDNINLVYELFQNVTIRIPSKNEGNLIEEKNSGFDIIAHDTGVIEGESGNDKGQGDMVNINLASKERFLNLPGIGEVYAQRIIEYRNENGRFESLDELLNISGIGEKTFENIRPFISLH